MNIIRLFRSRLSTQYIRKDLYSVLSEAPATASLEEKLNWLKSLLQWVRLMASPTHTSNEKKMIQYQRISYLLHFIEGHPELKQNVTQTFESILFESYFFDLFYASGIEQQQGFMRELFDRSVGRIIPTYKELSSIKNTFELIFSSEVDFLWFRELTPEQIEALTQLLCTSEFTEKHLRQRTAEELLQAIHLLAARAVGIIIEPDLRARLPHRGDPESPFFVLQRFIDKVRSHEVASFDTLLKPIITNGFTEIFSVYPVLETAGVSVDVVYKLEALQSILSRVELLGKFYDSLIRQTANRKETVDYILIFSHLHTQRASLSAFLGNSFNLIARKIVDRTSLTAEHYITRNKDDYREMFASSAGGGLITAFTTLVKILMSKQGLPLFFEGFFTGFNYAASFTLIQLSHFTLATKTPAITATTLANKLGDLSSPEKIEEFVDEAIALHRSAFIAVLGNLGLVIPTCILIDFLWLSSFGHHLITSDYGAHQLDAHSPFKSLSIFYATITGGILWFASIMGGWIENWCVYRHQFYIFEKSVTVRRYVGPRLQKKLSTFFRQNIAGLSTNILLGFMLSFCGIFGKFFGLPLEVRHVTLSTGTITFSALSLDHMADHGAALGAAALGIACIGIINFSVSFGLSLFVASRAKNLSLAQLPILLKRIYIRFRTRPKEFYLATDAPPSEQTRSQNTT